MTVNAARLLTMNLGVLKDLPLADVLAVHPLIDPAKLEWRRAQKNKPIKTKPISVVLNDDSVMSKIALATLEGHQAVKANSYLCWGVDNDIWQQAEANLYAKYDPGPVDDGWQHMQPKENMPIRVAQVTEGLVTLGEYGGFSIRGTYGDERVIDGQQCFLQFGILNDWLGMGLAKTGDDNPGDVYRIVRKFFDNTYGLL